MSKTKYIPLNPSELQLYKREKAIAETHREDTTNLSLIALRKQNLYILNHNPEFKAKIVKFNDYVKKKKIADMVKVINYLMSDLCN